jgi:hypothetical protein
MEFDLGMSLSWFQKRGYSKGTNGKKMKIEMYYTVAKAANFGMYY